MMTLDNFKAAEDALARYIPATRVMTGKHITLVRMEPLMEHLGNPQHKLDIIHVAGTSGKTSTSYYIAAILQLTGKKVGLTVSPHVACINERIQINLKPLPENIFCSALEEFLELIKNVQPEPSYFELLLAFVYWYFVKEGVDYAVVETGLGGLHDATNVANQPGKVCVITDIGYDHMHVLGDTIKEIAEQKAGIIHRGNTGFMYSQSAEIDKVILDYAREQGAILNVLNEAEQNDVQASGKAFKGLPSFQQRNWLLANHVSQYVIQRDGMSSKSSKQLESTMGLHVPGRMDIRSIDTTKVIFDGAHNEQKMKAFVTSFQILYPNKKVPILLALKEGKEHNSVLPLLGPICSQLIVTSFATSQDTPIFAINPEIIANAAVKNGFKNVLVEESQLKGYKKLLELKADICIVTGSFYLLGNLLPR